jgi:septal ring factor EnvC (AmiA/AmiB activator)
MAQDFFAAFGHDEVGKIGTETTINSGDIAGILMIAVQALERRTAELKQNEKHIAVLESKLDQKDTQIAELAARLETLELRQNQPMQTTAAK